MLAFSESLLAAVPFQLRVGMEVFCCSSVLRSSRTVWIEVSKIIIRLGPSQLTHDSVGYSLIVVEEARALVFPGLLVQTILLP